MKILLDNLSKELRKLFFAYLDRLEKEKERRVMTPIERLNPNIPFRQGYNSFEEGFKGVIYFYEWSDINRTPKTFYTLKAFETFLKESQIYLMGWEREVIRNMPRRYITCRKGKKELIIKCSYSALNDEIKEESSNDAEPYNVAITRPPSMRHSTLVYEPENRYPEQGEFWDW